MLLLSIAAGFDGTVKVWSVDPALEEMTTEVVSSANYFSKEAVGLGESGSEGFSHLGKIAWHPEVRRTGATYIRRPTPFFLIPIFFLLARRL